MPTKSITSPLGFDRQIAGRRLAAEVPGWLTACAAVLVIAIGAIVTRSPGASGPSVADPVSGIVEDILDTIDDAIEDLEGAMAGIQPAADPHIIGPRLASAEASIHKILDPNQAPSLDPIGAGQVESGIAPDSLDEYASESLALAYAARGALIHNDVDYELVGSKLKTIIHLLPGYRDAAGL